MIDNVKQGMDRNDYPRPTQKRHRFLNSSSKLVVEVAIILTESIYDEFYRFYTMKLVSTVGGAFQNEPRSNRFGNDTVDLLWDSHVRRIIPTAPVSIGTQSAS